MKRIKVVTACCEDNLNVYLPQTTIGDCQLMHESLSLKTEEKITT